MLKSPRQLISNPHKFKSYVEFVEATPEDFKKKLDFIKKSGFFTQFHIDTEFYILYNRVVAYSALPLEKIKRTFKGARVL